MIFQFKRILQPLILVALIVMQLGCTSKNEKQTEASETQDSCYTLSDFKFVPKIDVHAHINVEGRIMIEQAKAYNFKLMVMAVDVVPEYPPMEEQIRVRIKHHKENPDVFAFTTAFTLEGWDEPDWSDKVIEQLKRDFENGALGIKVWKNIGMGEKDKDGNLIMLDDPKFDPIFRFVKEQNKVVLSHAGEPKNCWLPIDEMTVNNDREYFSENPEYHMYLHPEMPSYEDQINARNNMLEKNKDMTFIAVHLASLEWSVDEIAAFLDRFPNASVDVAERLSHLQVQSIKDRQKVRNFIIKYQDRVLYGTDFQELENTNPSELKEGMLKTWMQDWKYLNTDEMMTAHQVNAEFQGLKLPKSVVDKIYRINAQKIFPNAWEN
ncbi:amidohydrolase family protein [Reichenbachiella sp. MALMAid0571]|uniref:amidohydrolase family protein n=1 Tax=Reichenbachiella sp. MALMAid0571 TaxID=3143939 RepID=UPI0032DF928B